MNYGSDPADQVVRYSLEGAEFALRISGTAAKNFYIREKVQPKYNCFQRGQRNKGGRDCDGQALYLAERVDAIVLKIVEEVFEQIRDTPYSQVAENRIRQESNLQKTKRAAAEKKIKAAQHALERFEGEILKCLDGPSKSADTNRNWMMLRQSTRNSKMQG